MPDDGGMEWSGAQAWSLAGLAGIVLVIAVGLPRLMGGGGRLRRGSSGGGRRGRGGYRVRVGPSLPVVLVLALARRADSLALAAATLAALALLVINAA
jgi:hypothetical protein